MKNEDWLYDRWLLQKRSICVYFCHIGKVQKGNKKPRSLDEKTGFKRAGPKGLEPSTSGLTGRRSNQLNYDPKFSSTSGDFSPIDQCCRDDNDISNEQHDGCKGQALKTVYFSSCHD